MPTPVPGPGRTITPKDFKPYESKVELRCQACGKKGRYLVGRIFIDPERGLAQGPGRVPDEGVAFTGYFHCRACGAGGPWELTPQSLLLMTGLLLEATHNP